jgi:transcriptional regulator with XRE-family HTH domain
MEVNMQKLRELRRVRVLTLRELEEESGVSYNTIWRLENGHRQARPSTIRKLATALGVEPAELVVAKESGDA